MVKSNTIRTALRGRERGYLVARGCKASLELAKGRDLLAVGYQPDRYRSLHGVNYMSNTCHMYFIVIGSRVR